MLSNRGQHTTSRLRIGLAIAVTTVVVAPTAAYATHVFTDVSDGAFYASSVSWAKTNGITAGCNPPTNTRFCPEDDVSRGQMAVFLNNLARSRAVDAGTLGGLDAGDFLRTTGKAADADRLDGLSSGAFLRKNATAANTKQVGGIPAAQVLHASVGQLGYGLACMPTVASYASTDCGDSAYNSAGGAVSFTRTGPGSYMAQFDGMDGDGGVPYVVIRGIGSCYPEDWLISGSSRIVHVACYNFSGVRVDRQYVILWLN